MDLEQKLAKNSLTMWQIIRVLVCFILVIGEPMPVCETSNMQYSVLNRKKEIVLKSRNSRPALHWSYKVNVFVVNGLFSCSVKLVWYDAHL